MVRRRCSGSISIMVALCFLLIITLISTCIKSAVYANGYTQIDMAARLAVESAFAGYSTTLMDEFDIMGLNRDIAGKMLRHYADENLNGICGMDVEYIYGDFESKVSMVACGGIGVEQQIIEYMKVGIYSDIMAKFMDIEKEAQKAEIVKEVVEDINACEAKVSEADQIIYEIIELVEGIKTTDCGVETYKSVAVPTGEYFAKAVITSPLCKEVTYIDKPAVYNGISGYGTKYTDVWELMDNMLEYAEIYDGLETDEEGNRVGETASDCEAGYDEAYTKMVSAMDGAINKIRAAIGKLADYDSKLKECRAAYGKCQQEVENQKEILGEELSKTLTADIDSLKQTNKYTGSLICNVYVMKVGLEHNLQILNKARNVAENLNVDLNEKEYDYIERGIAGCKESFRGLSNNLLKFNYDYVAWESGSGLKIIETLKNAMENGLGGLVMADKEVSSCSISYSDLASTYRSMADVTSDGFMKETVDTVLLNEYVMKRFPTATDYKGQENVKSKDDAEQWCELNYVVEYILCGNNSDKENLNGVLLKLAAMREGINMAHLMLDAEKKGEAMTLATNLVGVTGNAIVIKAAQYVILAVWALGESICDLRRLLDGEGLPMVKSKADWKLSLSNLMAMDFGKGDVSNKDKGGKDDDSDGSSLNEMCYEDYLRVLLLAQDATDKCFGVMNAMELRMMALGEKNFRMKDYIWNATGSVTLRYGDSREYCIREISYSYV